MEADEHPQTFQFAGSLKLLYPHVDWGLDDTSPLHLDFLNRILLELKRLCVFFASSFPHKDLWVLLEFLCMWIVIIALTYPAFQQGSPRWKTCTVGPRALFAASRRDLALRTWSLEPSAWYSRDYQPSWFRLQKANCPVADSVCENTLCIIA